MQVTIEDHRPAMQENHPLGSQGQRVQVMRGPKTRCARLRCILLDQPHQLLTRDGVQARCRFVEQEEFRLRDEQTRQRDASLLPEAQGVAGTHEEVADPKRLRNLSGATVGLPMLNASLNEAPCDVLRDRARDKVVLGVLSEKSDTPIQSLRQREVSAQLEAQPRHHPVAWGIEPCQDTK